MKLPPMEEPAFLPCAECGEPRLIVSLDGIETPSDLLPCFSKACRPNHDKRNERARKSA